jgi:thiamine-phosphate pyrophosphorylase
MRSGHPELPAVWLITDERLGPHILQHIRRLAPGAGVIVRQHDLPPRQRRALLRQVRRIANSRELTIVDDADGKVARVHSARELRRALLRRPALLFLSPLLPTRTHPAWKPLPRMRAAALVRLAKRPVLALGGVNEGSYSRIKALGFAGWGGIDAWGRSSEPGPSRG